MKTNTFLKVFFDEVFRNVVYDVHIQRSLWQDNHPFYNRRNHEQGTDTDILFGKPMSPQRKSKEDMDFVTKLIQILYIRLVLLAKKPPLFDQAYKNS